VLFWGFYYLYYILFAINVLFWEVYYLYYVLFAVNVLFCIFSICIIFCLL